MSTTITIIYDNKAIKGFISGWGFSALITKNNKNVLFDTGWDGKALLKNLQRANFDPKDIDFVIISHKHWDHLGGLSSLLNEANNPTVFVPSSLSSGLKAEITKFAGIREVTTTSGEEIIPGIKTTAELIAGGALQIREISLMLETKKGLVVVCGCSHPGLETILDYCEKFGTIYAALGGFHGFDKLARLQNIELIVPCHCTRKKGEILEKYPQNSRDCYAGLKLDFD